MTTPIGGAGLTSFAASLGRVDNALPAPGLDAPSGPAPTSAFADRLTEALADANTMQNNAQQVSEAYANGDRNDIHGTMIALEQADITLRFVSNVRNRLVEAYREVMRMGA